ncbi:MAG: hypothetical protein CMM15_07020 [Rhodospirillaceae bacterium]|nr:hypothetical protein [Rhodospirillaceae bacterium]
MSILAIFKTFAFTLSRISTPLASNYDSGRLHRDIAVFSLDLGYRHFAWGGLCAGFKVAARSTIL